MNPVRILVTGTRKNGAPIRERVFERLDSLVISEGFPLHRPIIVVHGKCPYGGVDKYADDWATDRGHMVERHPAAWARYGKRAGGMRNQEMVDAGADYCIGFPAPGSRGTWDCLQRATDALIPVQVHPIFV